MASNIIDAGIPETLKLPVMFLYHLGWFRDKSKKLLIFTTTYILVLTNLFLVGTIQLAMIKNTWQFVLNLETIFSMTQIGGKVCILAYYNKDLMSLLEDTYRFWDAEEQHKEAASKQKTYRRFVLNSQKIFLVFFSLGIAFSIISSYYRNSLIFGVWLIEGYDSMYRYVLLEEVICSIGVQIFLYALDCLYLGLCIEIIIQFKIISYNLRDLILNDEDHIETKEECINKLTSIVIHQQYMMRFLKKFKKLFSLILLFEYLTDAPLLLAELFAILESNSPAIQMRCMSIFIVWTVQLSFYCIPVNYLSDEISNVASAAYDSKWETHMFRSLRTPLVLLTQNTQNGDVIKAGGLVTINGGTVLNHLNTKRCRDRYCDSVTKRPNVFILDSRMAINVINAGIPETLKVPAMFLYHLGWFRNKSQKLLVVTATYLILIMNLFIIGTIQFSRIKNATQFVLNLETISTMTQVFGKVFLLAYYDKDLMNLLVETSYFWDAEVHQREAACKQKAYRKFVLNSQKTFLLIFSLTVAIAIVSSFYRNSLIFGVWLIEGYDSVYQFVLLEEVICLIGGEILLYSLVCLYFGMCIEIIIQFRIISYNLRDLTINIDGHIATEEECIIKLTSCIMHQQHMMRFLKKFKKVFSLILLLEYVTDAPILLVELYPILESNSHETQIRCISVFILVAVQLSFHCIPANYLSDEISNVANAAYSSNWETHLFRSLRTPLVLLVQNTQNGHVIKAGGLVTINAETVLTVLKVAWSLTSLMRGLK